MLTTKNEDQSTTSRAAPHRTAWISGNPIVDLLRLAIRPQSVLADSPTRLWIQRHPVLAVVGLAYALSWVGLLPVIRDPKIVLHADLGHASNPAVLLYVFIGVLGCLWAALIVAGAENGVKGRYALLSGYLKWQAGFQWYLVVLLGPAVILGAAMGLFFLRTGNLTIAFAPPLLSTALFSAYSVSIVRYLFGNFEEICWRATVLPRLMARSSALAASLIVGVIQGLWHLPYLFVSGHYVQTVGLPAIVLQSMAMGVVATWIYTNTRGSLLMVALFHAAFDASAQFQGSNPQLFILEIGLWCITAILLVILFGGRHLSHRKDPSPAFEISSPAQQTE